MAIPPPNKRYTGQMYVCRYCGARMIRPIGSGKPMPTKCVIGSRNKKTPVLHSWVYGPKVL